MPALLSLIRALKKSLIVKTIRSYFINLEDAKFEKKSGEQNENDGTQFILNELSE